MTALRKSTPRLPADEMARLAKAGFSLLPLGGGVDGKSPLMKFQGQPRFALGRVLAPMHRMGSLAYGIRLDGLAVIDCDTDDPELVAKLEARFGASPVHVTTPRGQHLYYRANGADFPNLRSEGLPVDIKRGASSYVMGPLSVRPDGGEYVPAKGMLSETNLPVLRGLNRRPAQIHEGARNYTLAQEAIQMVETVDDPDELFGNLAFLRDEQCENPETLPDSEVRKITDWAWSKRLSNNIYRGRDSEFRLHRNALDALKGLPNASDAIALFVTLQDLHGHSPAKIFGLKAAAMREAGHTDLSRERFILARQALERAGLLTIASPHIAGKQSRQYRLGRVRANISASANVHALASTALSQGEGV